MELSGSGSILGRNGQMMFKIGTWTKMSPVHFYSQMLSDPSEFPQYSAFCSRFAHLQFLASLKLKELCNVLKYQRGCCQGNWWCFRTLSDIRTSTQVYVNTDFSVNNLLLGNGWENCVHLWTQHCSKDVITRENVCEDVARAGDLYLLGIRNDWPSSSE